jgi:major membrane immunogen (membrane-anchored lipoprotein)
MGIVRSRYQATISEDTEGWKKLSVIWLKVEISDGAIIKCNYESCA